MKLKFKEVYTKLAAFKGSQGFTPPESLGAKMEDDNKEQSQPNATPETDWEHLFSRSNTVASSEWVS